MQQLGPWELNWERPSTTTSAQRSWEYLFWYLSLRQILCYRGQSYLKGVGYCLTIYYLLPNKSINKLNRIVIDKLFKFSPSPLLLLSQSIKNTNELNKQSNLFIGRSNPSSINMNISVAILFRWPSITRAIVIFLSYYMTYQTAQTDKVEQILLELNKTGLSYLKYLQFNEAIDFFKKAEKIVNEEMFISTDNQKMNQLAGVTFNNLACYYKKTKRPKVALNYLKKSLQIEVYKINDWVSTGSTHLNICAIYSYLNKHDEALSHAKLAAELLEKKIYNVTDASEESKSYWNIKMLCYYNMAIQEQHLKMYQASLASYSKAKDIAKIFGSKNVGIILNCDEAIARIETQLASLKKKMINIFMKKKEDEQTGHYNYMRNHRPITKIDDRFLSHEKINRLAAYQGQDPKKKISVDVRNRGKPEALQIVERRSNSTKFKTLNQYLNQKYKTEPESAK